MRSILRCMVAAILLISVSHVQAGNIFDLSPDTTDRATFSLTAQLAAVAEPSSEMLRRLDGVLCDLKGNDLKELRACAIATGKPPEVPADAVSVCFVHLRGKKTSRIVEVLHTPDGSLLARIVDVGTAAPATAGLNEDRFNRLTELWCWFRNGFDADPGSSKPGEVAKLAAPLIPGAWTFDQQLLGARLLAGRTTRLAGMTRTLADDTILARAPRAYDPHHTSGLLVWVHASNEAVIPATLIPAAEELGLVCVAVADAGNDCPAADRYQRIFDALTNACAAFHVHSEHVYVTGISGGGKVSSMLAACFPDVFRGCIPIVGLAGYESVPIGDGTAWPALFAKPQPAIFRLLKEARFAPVTGNKDFNHDSILGIAKVFERDGVPLKLFDFQDLDHELPSAVRFAEVLRWVDEPFRVRRDAAVSRADAMLAKTIPDGNSVPTADALTRKTLIDITSVAPWSDAAWKAAELLRAK